MTVKKKTSAAILLSIAAAFFLFVYTAGPRTNYTRLAKFIYNAGYISTFCTGGHATYSGDNSRFSFLALKGMSIEPQADKDGNISTWFSIDEKPLVRVFTSNAIPEAYRQTAKKIQVSKRVPQEIRAKVALEGITLGTLPWIISEDADPDRAGQTRLIPESIKTATFKNGLTAVTFALAPAAFVGGDPTKIIAFLGPAGQLCEISAASTDYTVDYSLYNTWRLRYSGLPKPLLPPASLHKKTQCQLNEIANSLEFK